jgi:SAM-dependent methyltransferase
VDICRTYLDIGVQRMGKNLPHLIIGDIENLPIKTDCLNAVLCYDAFHHIPDRKKAMSHFTRALGDRGNIVLAEPGGTHEFAKVSTDVMDKYGILEKGMEKDDIINYCEGLNVLPPEQHYVVKIQDNELEKTLTPEFVYTHAHVNCNIFVVKKQKDVRGLNSQGLSFKQRIKKKIKRVLVWFFYKLVG